MSMQRKQWTIFQEDHYQRFHPSDGGCECEGDSEIIGEHYSPNDKSCLIGDAEYYSEPDAADGMYHLTQSARRIAKLGKKLGY